MGLALLGFVPGPYDVIPSPPQLPNSPLAIRSMYMRTYQEKLCSSECIANHDLAHTLLSNITFLFIYIICIIYIILSQHSTVFASVLTILSEAGLSRTRMLRSEALHSGHLSLQKGSSTSRLVSAGQKLLRSP